MAHQYQKIYMNQIHSSSLLCQLSQMLKAQLLCDALIETGDVVTKAHRVVLVAACPMLQSLGPCETGSELKIRLPSNIQPESVQSFLQYLYEGFTTLTDINIHDVEKIARLLQVDCLVKCCADFSQILNEKTGMPMNSQSQFKYTLPDMFEFRHVRHSELMKLALNRNCKRASESIANSELKKQRLSELEAKKFSTSSQFGQVTDDRISMAKTYKNDSYSTSSAKSDVNDDCVIVDNFQSGPKESNVFEERLELLENHSGDKEDCNDSNCAVVARVGVMVSSHTNMEKSIQEIDMENYNGKSSLSSGEKDQSVSSASVSMKELDECTPKSKMSMSSEVFTIDKHHPEKPLPNSVTEANNEVESISSEKMSETSQQVTLEKDLRNSEESMLSCVSSNRHESLSTLNGGIDEQTKAAEARQDESDVISTKQSQDSHVSSPLAESRLVQTGSSSTMSSSAHSDEMPDLSIVKIERVGRGHDIFGIDAQVDTEDNYSAVRDPADCEEYNREDYGNDELDESQLSSHSEGMQGEHDTSWYVGTFKDWLTQQGLFSDFEAAHMGYLNQLLSTFYTSIIATNKGSITRSMLSRFPLELSTHMAMPPHSRNVDITNQPEFATSNQILELMTQTLPLEEQKLLFRSYQPRQPMNREDLQILYRSGVLSKRTPECLQNKVWVEVMMYFGCLGRQVLRNLTKQSLILENDLGCGRRYFRLVDKVGKREEIENTKIYEQPGFENCPVESLMLYLSKLNPSTNVLFQQPLKPRATSASIWYSHRPIGKNVHSNMLTLICREAGIPVAYQNSSLRVFTQNLRQTADSPQFSDMVASLIREDIVLVTDDFSPLSSLQTGASGQRNIIY